MEKIPYSKQIEEYVEADGDWTVEDTPVPGGMYLFVQGLACRNRDNAPSKIIVGRGRGEEVHHLWEEEPSPVADVLYHNEKMHHVPNRQNVLAVFEGCTAGDHLELYVEGYLTPESEDW